jgi:diguanylate cyclase (GGDEF)-like protein
LRRADSYPVASCASLSLLLIEIDDFADHCNQFGAAAADHARYAVSQTLINSVRPTDLVACNRSTRFAVVLSEAEIEGAYRVAERPRFAVSVAVC